MKTDFLMKVLNFNTDLLEYHNSSKSNIHISSFIKEKIELLDIKVLNYSYKYIKDKYVFLYLLGSGEVIQITLRTGKSYKVTSIKPI